MLLRFETTATKVRVQKWSSGVGGEPTLLAFCDLRSDRAKQTELEFRLGAPALGVTKEELWSYVRAYQDGGESCIPLGIPREPVYRVRARTGIDTRAYHTFAEAITAATGQEEVIEWDDKELCCALDLDFHQGVARPVSCAARALRPVPHRWWVTRSGGLRCIYLATKSQTADALASLAAYSLLLQFPAAGMELLTRTRRPPEGTDCGGPTPVQDDGSDVVRKLSGTYTIEDSEYAEYLEERGWVLGGRYPHTDCPANPSPRGGGNANPVVVHEDHIFCYICAADELCYGSHTPGYFPAARLCGGYCQSLLSLCVSKFTHWEHAKHVLDTILPGRANIAKGIYRAALARRHGPDPRIPLVFVRGENLIRYEGHWGDAGGRPVTFREDRPARLYELPAVLYSEEGELKASSQLGEWLRHTGDIACYGYPAVCPVFGIAVSQHVPPEGWRVPVVLQSATLAPEAMRDRRPRYLPASSRMPEAAAWAILEQALPGINRAFVELLIACKGLAEVASGMPPMLFVTGPTGAGKSVTVKAAAAMLGDHAGEIPFSGNTERLRAGLLSAKKKGSFAFFDEYLKGAAREKRNPTQGMEALLNFTPDSESHMLYVGPVPLGPLPVCIWGDTSIPVEVVQHAQLARRLAWVKLPSRMHWEPTLAACGIPGPDSLRSHGNAEMLEAMNSLVSCVIDRRFNSVPLFSDLVRALGFRMLEDVDIAKEREAVIVAFFDAVCAAGPDWVKVDRNTEGVRLTDLWKSLADPSGASSRAIEETDLAAVCRLRTPARFECKTSGFVTNVRFVADDNSGVANAALVLTPQPEPATVDFAFPEMEPL